MKFEKNRITSLRENLGLSQAEFARNIEVSRQNVNNWEMGNTKPTVDSLCNICRTYDIEISYFFV